MPKVYRVIEYEYEDNERGHRWIETMRRLSIYGKMVLGNGFSITAAEVHEGTLMPAALVRLDAASQELWTPPEAEQRAKSRGDV